MKKTMIGIVVVSALIAGCGGSDSSSKPESGATTPSDTRLDAEDALMVAKARRAFDSTVLDSSRYRETLRGVDDLIGLCRENPKAIYQVTDDDPELTMRQVVEDGANTLERFQPSLASKLARVADSGCG